MTTNNPKGPTYRRGFKAMKTFNCFDTTPRDVEPDVSALVEALELVSVTGPNEGTAWLHEIAYKALAAYRKGGEQ